MYEEFITRGIKGLDLIRPDWPDLIDVDQLHQTNLLTCVLGQVFGDFGSGISAFERAAIQWTGCGFALFPHHSKQDWNQLSEEWRVAIAERQTVRDAEDVTRALPPVRDVDKASE